MSVYDPCTQKIKARMNKSHLLSTTVIIDSLVKITSDIPTKCLKVLFLLLIYNYPLPAIELYSTAPLV